jgi:hypothetical protein
LPGGHDGDANEQQDWQSDGCRRMIATLARYFDISTSRPFSGCVGRARAVNPAERIGLPLRDRLRRFMTTTSRAQCREGSWGSGEGVMPRSVGSNPVTSIYASSCVFRPSCAGNAAIDGNKRIRAPLRIETAHRHDGEAAAFSGVH